MSNLKTEGSKAGPTSFDWNRQPPQSGRVDFKDRGRNQSIRGDYLDPYAVVETSESANVEVVSTGLATDLKQSGTQETFGVVKKKVRAMAVAISQAELAVAKGEMDENEQMEVLNDKARSLGLKRVKFY